MAVEIKGDGSTVVIVTGVETANVASPSWATTISSSRELVTVSGSEYVVDILSTTWGCDVVSGIMVGGMTYDGEYELTPTAAGEVLQTKLKTMLDDLTVNPIPYHETTNDSGGYTISIAS